MLSARNPPPSAKAPTEAAHEHRQTAPQPAPPPRTVIDSAAALARLHALAMHLGDDEGPFFAEILTATADLCRAEKAIIQLFEPEAGWLRLAAHHGMGRVALGYFDQQSHWPADASSWRDKGRLVVTDLEAMPPDLTAVLRAERIGAVVYTPLISRAGEPLGLLNLYFSKSGEPTEIELQSLDLVARLTADFVERTNLLKTRQRERAHFRCAAAASGQHFFRVSADWIQMQPLLGEDSSATRGCSSATWLQDHVHPDDHLPVLAAIEHARKTGEAFTLELRARRPDGTERWVMSRAIPCRNDVGEITAWLGAVTDITARHHLEQELRRHEGQLEERVLERTADLDAVNGSLRDEIVERGRRQRQHLDTLRRLAGAQEDERRRISRELHDEIGQLVASLLLGLNDLAEAHAIPEDAEELRQLRTTTQAIAAEVHNLAVELRPTSLDDLGLVRALRAYAESWASRTMICADFHASGFEGRLEPAIETTIYRIVQEALTNVFKHARARQVSIVLTQKPTEVSAIVEDDGIGFDPARTGEGHGFTNMRDRLGAFGGAIEVRSVPGHGTTVRGELPLSPGEAP